MVRADGRAHATAARIAQKELEVQLQDRWLEAAAAEHTTYIFLIKQVGKEPPINIVLVGTEANKRHELLGDVFAGSRFLCVLCGRGAACRG